jgi:hypothetical protein
MSGTCSPLPSPWTAAPPLPPRAEIAEDGEVPELVVVSRRNRFANGWGTLRWIVNGHQDLPISGQEISPPMANKPPHWWPSEPPAGGQVISPPAAN